MKRAYHCAYYWVTLFPSFISAWWHFRGWNMTRRADACFAWKVARGEDD